MRIRLFSTKNKHSEGSHLGYSEYQVLSHGMSQRLTQEERLRNNLPRYTRQAKVLRVNHEVQVIHAGLVLKYFISNNQIKLKVFDENSSIIREEIVAKIQRVPWKFEKSLQRFMALTEVRLWP